MTERRGWTLDLDEMASQIVEHYRHAPEVVPADADTGQTDLEALATIESWRRMAADHGEQITEDDLISLILRIARVAAA